MGKIINFQTPFDCQNPQNADRINQGIKAYAFDQHGRPRGIPDYLAINLFGALHKHSAKLQKIAHSVETKGKPALLMHAGDIMAFVKDIMG